MGSKNKQSKNKDKDSKTDVARDDGGTKLITDPRFASVHSDPRFAKFTPHKAKVKIDSRFERVFTDKSFSSSSAKIDKRGKPKKDTQNPLKRYYQLEDEEEEKEKKRIEEVKGRDVEIDEGSEESDSESEREEELKKPGKKTSNLELKNKLEEEESEEDKEEEEEDGDEVVEANDNSSTDTTDSEEENEIDSEEEGDLIPEENVPDIDKETHRLAVVNLDWSHVTAVDLFVLLSSFLPKGGQILSVAVYPSEFGLKRMEEEAVRGPVVLFDDNKEQNESGDDHDDDDDDDSDGDDEIDVKKLREYELSRLRYYYAVVECDSIATADYLYKSCDGIEFERSSNKLDLRFIPDSMEFKHPPRDVATEAPAKYEGLDFQTRALQQSNIHLTWEEDEPQRAKALKRKFNGDQIAEMELKEFLASDESESDEDENDDAMEDRPQKKHRKQDMYRALLQSGEDSGADDEDGQDMEVTFNTGLEDISKHALEKKDKKSETVWDAQLRKRREKKMARKNSSKYSTDDETSDSNREPKEDVDDFFVEEPSVKASKEGKGKSDEKGKKNEETAKEAEAASVAELELLLADGNGADASLKGYNLKHKKVEGKGKKGRKEKRKREEEIPNEGKLPSVDYNDPRFSAIFTSPLFALDPTDPQFKRSATYARQLAQKRHKVDQEVLGSKPAQLPSDDLKTEKNEAVQSDEMASKKKEKYELSSLVRSIKMKSKQVQIRTDNKISGKTGKSGSKARW
ncbi:pre-rRNA-processing protein esf1 [Rhododendron vialii]|uniref:pre-rRNA-processing protein esf1 n=1 Tax=Rhododendron vialii TaxID=182163 RepID=UPI00265FAD31|nr:pre-rRNA-processing protein esf1 [Rhododendron vialii]